jgi:4-amino-4-deoxychorismate lyase
VLYSSINGQPIDLLSVRNRGFNYGDGLFTTAKIFNGEIEMLTEHLQRLDDGCVFLKIPMVSISELSQELKTVALSYSKAVIKIIITAGEGGRGYSRIGTSSPTVIISVSAFPEHYENWQKNGINLGISQLQLGINPMLGNIKHLNRLEQVLIRQELDHRDEDEILVTNINGLVIETSGANVFWLTNDKLYTPNISHSGVAGLMRAKILSNKPNTIIKDFTLEDLQQVQAMFICNSVMGIVPIKIFNGKLLSIDKANSYKCL